MSTTTLQVPEHLTDNALKSDIEQGQRLGLRGMVRQAEILLDIDPKFRLLAKRDATRRSNMTGERFSDSLWRAVEYIKQGRLTEETYAEATKAFREMGY